MVVVFLSVELANKLGEWQGVSFFFGWSESDWREIAQGDQVG